MLVKERLDSETLGAEADLVFIQNLEGVPPLLAQANLRLVLFSISSDSIVKQKMTYQLAKFAQAKDKDLETLNPDLLLVEQAV